MRFTVTWIEKLKAASIRRDFTETNRPGFMLRVEPTGAKAFYYRYQFDGQRRPLKLGTYPETTLEEAHRRFEEARKIRDHGDDPAAVLESQRLEDAAADSAGELIDFWYTWHALKNRKRPEAAKALLDKNIPAWFRELKAKDVRRHHGARVLEAVARRSEAVAKDVGALIVQIFSYALANGKIEASPFVGLKAPGAKETPRSRLLTDAELRAIWLKLPDCEMSERVRLALELLLLTAVRRGELAQARWADIDLEAKTWLIPAAATKTGEAHLVPLSSLAISHLERLKELAGDSLSVFPNAHVKVKADQTMTERAITRAVRENEDIFAIPHWTPHDFRRAFRSAAHRLGIADTVAEKVLGHRLPGIAGVYNVYEYAAEKRAALETWCTHIQKLIVPEQAPRRLAAAS